MKRKDLTLIHGASQTGIDKVVNSMNYLTSCADIFGFEKKFFMLYFVLKEILSNSLPLIIKIKIMEDGAVARYVKVL